MDFRAEEKIVLESIYTSEEISITDDYKIQFRLGTPGELESFVVNITWPLDYPSIPPIIDFNEFCNRNMPSALQQSLISELNEIASQNVGESHTFILIEHLRDNFEKYAQQIRDAKRRPKEQVFGAMVGGNTKEKKCRKDTALTKAQKRKQINRLDSDGNLPRGWNWVDVIKHLRQTGVQANLTS
nr:RWD domain containing protein 4 [Hymenolepis microstoma]